MCAAYALINPVQEIKAQTDTTQVNTQHELDEVEVSGQRAPVIYSQMARVVSVITRKDIEQAPVFCINDLLKTIPQVDLRQRGPNGSQADISIQGGSFDQTLILLNGINLTDPQTGHLNLNLPLDLNCIDRIEVLKGPASRVFGANAFSGAVNFVTGLDTANYVKASLVGGDYGLYQASLAYNLHSQRFNNFIAASKSQSDGYTHNTKYDTKNMFYHGKAFFGMGSVGYQFGYISKESGENSFYTPFYPNQYEYTDTYLGSINGELRIGSVKLTPAAYWRRNYDHYILNSDNPKFYQNFHYTDVLGTNLNAMFTSYLGKTSVGFEYRKEAIYSTRLGKLLDETVKIPGQDSIRYTKGRWRENLGFFLEHNVFYEGYAASFGVMANRNSLTKKVEFYPGVDLSYQWNRALKCYVTVNRSLRLPTFTDMYYEGPVNIGNPDLKPEKAQTFETGIKFGWKGASGHVSYFHRWASDVIDWVRKTSSDKWTTVNYTELNADGLEFFARLLPKEIVPSLSFIKEATFSYAFTNLSKSTDSLLSNYALDNLKHKMVIRITHQVWKNVGASWAINWQDRNGTYDDFSRYDPVTKVSPPNPYKSFMLVDGRVFYAAKFFRAFVEASNIFDVDYMDIGNIAQPGRWIKAGIEVKIVSKR